LKEWELIATTTTSSPTFLTPSSLVGRKMLLLAEAVSVDKNVVLMSRTTVTQLCLSVPSPPPVRNFLSNPHITQQGGQDTSTGKFRVISYNILSEIYATAQQYPYVDFWALAFEYRFRSCCEELITADGDCICLQEVQGDYYESHIRPWFESYGYDGVYKAKDREGMAGKVDGCATFWKRSKMVLIEAQAVSFNDLASRYVQSLGYRKDDRAHDSIVTKLKKDNIAQFTVLELSGAGRSDSSRHSRVCVVNTHFYSNKDYPEIKLWQAWQLTQALEEFAISRNLPVVLCGDLNSTPTSAVYSFLAGQQVDPSHPDVVNDQHGLLPDPRGITHSLPLDSAYRAVTGSEPPFTNYTDNFKGVLDYIWYDTDNVRPVSAATMLDVEDIEKDGIAIPNVQFGSDHIMMISDLQLVGNR
jgi:CCR4-NOT transcription complex subunit 6